MGLIGNLDVMFGAGYAEKVDRPECEAILGMAVEREFDLLAAVAPCAVVVPALEASEVGCTGTEKYAGLAVLDCHLRCDDVGCPFDPVPPGRCYEVWRVIGPVRLAISVPGVFAKDLVLKHDKR